jgi:hypothetical protein
VRRNLAAMEILHSAEEVPGGCEASECSLGHFESRGRIDESDG